MTSSINKLKKTLRSHTCLQSGMSIIEMMLAMLVLVMFTSQFLVATQFISRFMAQAESSFNPEKPTGILVDQNKLQLVMDQLVEALAQPGFTKDELLAITGDVNKVCSRDPWLTWGVPGQRLNYRSDYRFCLRSTTLHEPQLPEIIFNDQAPGIYVIQALPDKLALSSLPARRIFCRPKPFC